MQLENSNVDLRTTAWFLQSLFYKVGRKYTCTRTKTTQLLSILALEYAANGTKIFEENIYKNDKTAVEMKELICLYEREYIGVFEERDTKEYINDSLDSSKDNLVPFIYRGINLDSSVMMKTVDVFRNFGSYSQTDLGNLLNPIIGKITQEDDTVDLSKITTIIDEDNKIMEYVKSSHVSNLIENKEKVKIMTKKY